MTESEILKLILYNALRRFKKLLRNFGPSCKHLLRTFSFYILFLFIKRTFETHENILPALLNLNPMYVFVASIFGCRHIVDTYIPKHVNKTKHSYRRYFRLNLKHTYT